ncbi:MAG: hypothetical protein GF368_02335 [Candidatus Aenigmarchaeota archaeon]|nr:hypothetical protein [Candidatus Aenigmarchaeota archaeon]
MYVYKIPPIDSTDYELEFVSVNEPKGDTPPRVTPRELIPYGRDFALLTWRHLPEIGRDARKPRTSDLAGKRFDRITRQDDDSWFFYSSFGIANTE